MYLLFRNFLLISILLWILSLFQILIGNFIFNESILFVNGFALLSYSILIYYFVKVQENKCNSKLLFWTIFIYSIFYVFIFKIIYFYHHGNFFIIGALDAVNYSNTALRLFDETFYKIITITLKKYAFSDLGAILYISLLYKIIPSSLIVDFANIILGVLSALALFKLTTFFVPQKYAFFCSVSYFCSSFVLQFESSGLKEPLFVFIIILCFLSYYRYIFYKKLKYLFYFSILALSILLFRPSVLGFVLLSIGAGFFLQIRKGFINVIIVIFVIIGSVYAIATFEDVFQQFSSFDKSIELRADITGTAGTDITIYAAAVSGLFGPLPTVLPIPGKEIQSISSVGLIFRILISIPFWIGVLYIFYQKKYELYPVIIMVIVEMVSLIYIIESFELRYHLIHLPFVYFISVYYLYNFTRLNPRERSKKKLLMNIASIGLFLIITYWNLRI